MKIKKNIPVCAVVKLLMFFFLLQNSYAQDKIKAFEKELSSSNDATKVILLNKIGQEYISIDPSKAITNSKKALELAQKIDKKDEIAKSYLNIGIAYLNQGYYKDAFENLLIAQKEYEERKNKKGIADTYLRLGMLYADLKDDEKALTLYKKAVDSYTSMNHTNEVALTYTKVAAILLTDENKIKEAHEYLVDAFELYEKNENSSGIASVRYYLSLLYISDNNLPKAKHHILKSINVSRENNSKCTYSKSTALLGKILRLEKDYTLSQEHLEKGLQMAKDHHLHTLELFVYDELRQLNELLDQPKEALVYSNKFTDLNASLFNYTLYREISSLERKNKIVGITEGKSEDQLFSRNSYIIFGAMLLLIGIITTLFVLQLIKNKKYKNQISDVQDNSELQGLLDEEKSRYEKLKKEFEFKNKQLTSYTFNFQQKDEIINKICNIARSLEGNNSSAKEKEFIQELIAIGKENLYIDKQWEQFRTFFEETQAGFYTKLKLKHQNLKPNDLKLCSLIRLNLNIKEAASILNISSGSLKTARYRLRKKLDLDPGVELIDYLMQVELE